jgi:phosphoribosylamine--glycine ligase
MKVLVIGKGGREHALVWKLARSRRTPKLFCAPGNAGTGQEATNVPIEPTEIEKLLKFAQKEKIDLTIVGPEDPLALGIVDLFQKNGLRIFGPNKEGAQLESSKVFAKTLMRDANVPTAEFRVFDHPAPAKTYIETREYPVVVKADGLAGGKGVLVCSTKEEALSAIDRIMSREEFGRTAGRNIVVEKRLDGEELSVLALVSGHTIVPLQPCQDHKPAFDGDKGPNTGGMGAYSPTRLGKPELLEQIDRDVLVPTIHGMHKIERTFNGVLYAGLMLTNQGPRVLEYNCRFGDPETQPLMVRLRSDLLDLLEAVVDNKLEEVAGKGLEWDPRPAVCVVLATRGYPGHYEKGLPVDGLEQASKVPDVTIFHAGTRLHGNRVLSDGGRVLGVTALGDTVQAARQRAYQALEQIDCSLFFYRRDIAYKGL